MRVGPADVVDAGDLLVDRLGDHVEGSHRIDEPEWPALLAGPVVGHHQHDRVVEAPGPFDEIDQSGELLVEVFEHRAVRTCEPGEESTFVVGVLIPGTNPEVAWRQGGAAGHDAEFDLPGEAVVACLVPSLGEALRVLVDQVARRLVGSVAGARGDHQEPWRLGDGAVMTGEEADRLVDQVGRQVVAGGVVARGGDVGVVADHFGGVLVGLGVEESVVAVEAPAERPTVERSGRPRLGQSR